MDAMTPLDAAFLELEDADPHASLHVASVALFAPPAPTYDELLDAFAGKLPLVPRYRQRVLRVPFELGPPVWADDPGFDPSYHLRETRLPPPGDEEQLKVLLSRLMSTRLDRDRPLWEAWLVEGLADGRWAIVSKVHHCMVDGISGTDLLAVMFDTTPEPSPAVADDWAAESLPSDARLLTDALAGRLREPVRVLDAGLRAVRDPAALLRSGVTIARGLAGYASALRPVDASTLTGGIGAPRLFTWARGDLDDVTAARKAFGGTLNDVVLTAISGGFRSLLLARGERPTAHTLRSLVPVSVRRAGDEHIRDNRVSAMLADLPVHVADPVERLAEMRRRLEHLKHSGEKEAGASVTSLAAFAPFELVGAALRTVFRLPQRQVATVTTNVPGPACPLFVAGRPLVELFPYVPIGFRIRVGVSIFTYCDRLTFGLTGDRDHVPDLEVLARGIEQDLHRLGRRARTPARTRARPHPPVPA